MKNIYLFIYFSHTDNQFFGVIILTILFIEFLMSYIKITMIYLGAIHNLIFNGMMVEYAAF